MVKLFAKVAGVALALLGLIGLLVGEGYLFGVFNVDLFEDVLHLVTGALLLYAGFGRPDAAFVRNVVRVLGLMYLLYGTVGFVYSPLLGFLPDPLTLVDNLFHLGVGLAGLAAVGISRREGTRKA